MYAQNIKTSESCLLYSTTKALWVLFFFQNNTFYQLAMESLAGLFLRKCSPQEKENHKPALQASRGRKESSVRKGMVLDADLLLRLEGDGVPEALQSAERAFDDTLLLPRLKKGGPEIAVGLLVTQHVVDNDEKAVGDRHHGFLLTQAPGQAMVLSGEVVVFHVRKHPDHLGQGRFESFVALSGLAAQPLASTLAIAGTDASPRGQMSCAGKAPHVRPDFAQNASRRLLSHAWNAHQQLHRFVVGLQILLDLEKQVKDRLIQKADVGQQMGEQDLVMRIDTPQQRFAQLGDLFVQRPLSQLGEHLRGLLP